MNYTEFGILKEGIQLNDKGTSNMQSLLKLQLDERDIFLAYFI